jgi:transposase InsO family protein
MDWHTRAVLSWKLSNTLDTAFCLDALKEAVATAGTPLNRWPLWGPDQNRCAWKQNVGRK